MRIAGLRFAEINGNRDMTYLRILCAGQPITFAFALALSFSVGFFGLAVGIPG